MHHAHRQDFADALDTGVGIDKKLARGSDDLVAAGTGARFRGDIPDFEKAVVGKQQLAAGIVPVVAEDAFVGGLQRALQVVEAVL